MCTIQKNSSTEQPPESPWKMLASIENKPKRNEPRRTTGQIKFLKVDFLKYIWRK